MLSLFEAAESCGVALGAPTAATLPLNTRNGAHNGTTYTGSVTEDVTTMVNNDVVDSSKNQ